MTLKTKFEKQFCKYCRGELLNSIERELEGHASCINALPSCDKCKTINEPLKQLKHIYDPKYKKLCLNCIKFELKRRTDILIHNIQNQYDLSKNDYKITIELNIEDVSL